MNTGEHSEKPRLLLIAEHLQRYGVEFMVIGGQAAALHGSPLATYDVGDLEAIKKYASIKIDGEGVITHFEEKPEKPESTLTGIALYYFAPETLELFTTYIAAGNNPDQPGRFIQWLYTRRPVKTYQIKGTWYDIGSKETLEEANKIFARK
jgi:glucose-1-phosphate thymidylyltransferase